MPGRSDRRVVLGADAVITGFIHSLSTNRVIDLIMNTMTTFTELYEILAPIAYLLSDSIGSRWMDGAFLVLDAEAIEGEVDEYWRDTYKIQKVFNQKLKRLQMERDELEREKKRKRHDSDGAKKVEEEPLHIPSALTVCNTVQDQMKDFKVTHKY